MITHFLIAMLVIFGLLAGWIGVQHLSRVFARRHPEFGPAREEGGGCGFLCRCKGSDTCPRKSRIEAPTEGVRPLFNDDSDRQ
ncbi:MAG: hypothetical protein R3F07_11025 [Opitutaceae bacterium]